MTVNRDGGVVGGAVDDSDVGDGRVDASGLMMAGCVEHDHGRADSTGRDATACSAPGGAHRSRTAVAARVPAGALGLLAAAMVAIVSADSWCPDSAAAADDGADGRGPVSHLVDVLVVVFAGARAPWLVAAPVRRRRAEVLVRPGAGAAVAAVHLHLDCRHGKNIRIRCRY